MKIALFDMARRDRSPTYDFFQWMMYVKIIGYEHINFANLDRIASYKYYPGEARKRFFNYVEPAPALLGMTSSMGKEGEDEGSHWLQDLIALRCTEFPRIKSPNGKGPHRYTVTIRNDSHKPEKNSNEEVWRRFADEIDAYVIEDYSVKPISLYDRLYLLAGAEMNYGLPNGPVSLLQWTDYPMRMFADPNNYWVVKSFKGHGVRVDGQLPYWRPNQRIVWQKPKLENLLREHANVSAGKQAAA